MGDRYRSPKPAVGLIWPKSKSLTRLKTWPASMKPTAPRPPTDRHAEFGVEDQDRVAARREPVGVDGLERNAQPIERVPADRRVAAGKEPLAGGQVRHHFDRWDRRPDRGPARRRRRPRHLAGKAARKAQPRARRKHRGPAARQPAVEEPLRERLDEADLRADGPRGDVVVPADQRAARGRQRVVAGIADRRRADSVDNRTCGNSRSMSGLSSGSSRSSNSLARSIT